MHIQSPSDSFHKNYLGTATGNNYEWCSSLRCTPHCFCFFFQLLGHCVSVTANTNLWALIKINSKRGQ